MRFTWKLFKETFQYKGLYSEQRSQIEAMLCTKSWVLHCVTTSSRILFPLLGVAYWQKAYKDVHKNDTIDQEFVSQSEVVVKAVIIGLIPIGVLIDIVCWRHR